MSDEQPRPSARDLVRTRSRSYRAPETGRHHHIGAAPERQPVLGDDGHSYVGTAPVQLAARTVAQLQAQAERLRADMAAAAADLRFEDAAARRDDLERIEAELRRRSG
jgi:excinuclease UvrABC helicase subunit UvrB